MKERLRALAWFLLAIVGSQAVSETILRFSGRANCPGVFTTCVLGHWSSLGEAEQHLVLGVNLVGALLGCAMAAVSGRKKKSSAESVHGSARWATVSDVRTSGLLRGDGVFVGQLADGRYLRQDGPEHYSVIAPSRSGKGAGIVVPTLLTWPESTIVYDLKEENWRITAGQRAKIGRVIRFSPSSVNSARFNPLAEVRLGIHEVRDVQNIANMIVDPDGSGYSDHWTKTGHSLLVATILHILYVGEEKEKNLSGVARFLSKPERTLSEALNEMKNSSHIRGPDGEPLGPHPVVAAAARDMLNKADNERSGVLSTAMSFLTLYRDPIVAANTEVSDFRIMDLVEGEGPVSLYLVVPPSDIERLKPLVRLMVNQFCRRLTEELDPKARSHRLLLMLDEFPALGKLEFFESALGFLAGYGIKAMLVSQSLNQLRKTYGQNSSILDNCHVRIFYAPNTVETAEYVSRSLGTTTVHYESQGQSRPFGSLVSTSTNLNQQITGRPLLTPREVMELASDESLVFVGNHAPIRCRKVKYYDDSNFAPYLLVAPVAEPHAALKIDGSFWRDRVSVEGSQKEGGATGVQNDDIIVITPVINELEDDFADELV